MDEFQANVEKLAVLADEIVALLPDEPSSELEAKAAEMVARLIQHLEYMDETGDDEVEAEDGVEVEVELGDEAAPAA